MPTLYKTSTSPYAGNPDLAEAYYSRGNANTSLEQYLQAVTEYDKADTVQTQLRRSLHAPVAADANSSLGQHAEAIKDYDFVIQHTPNEVIAYHNRGLIKAELGEYAAAIADYDEAIQRNPNNVEVYIDRGTAKFNLHKYALAVQDYDKAYNAIPIEPIRTTIAELQRVDSVNMQRHSQTMTKLYNSNPTMLKPMIAAA